MSARRYINQYLNSWHKNLIFISGSFTVTSSQTTDTANYKTSALTGNGIKSVALVGTGVYKVTMQDNYTSQVGFESSWRGPVGTPVAIASLVNGTPYTVSTVGTSAAADWILGGLPAPFANIMPGSAVGATTGAQVGMAFVGGAGAAGAAGTGFAAPAAPSGISVIQLYGNPNLTSTSNQLASSYPYFFIQTLYTAAGPILAPSTPVDTTVIRLNLLYTSTGVNSFGVAS